MKTIKRKQEKYNLIINLKILQGIPLFQAVAVSKTDILPSHQQRSYP